MLYTISLTQTDIILFMIWHAVFFVLIGIWLLTDIYLVFLHHSHQNNQLEEKNSKYWMVLFICMGMLLVILLNDSAKIAWMKPFNWFRWLGLGLLVAGILIRWIAVIQLGNYFHSNVGTIDNHALVTSGIYSKVRHPSYSGLLLNFVGVALVFSYPLSSLVAVILPIIGLLIRIHVEEKILLKRFQSEYNEYKKRTKKLIPWIY